MGLCARAHIIQRPIDLVVFSLFAVLVCLRLKPSTPQTLPRAPPPTVFRTFTPPSLFPYNGLNGMPRLPCCVWPRLRRNLQPQFLRSECFDEEMLTKDLDGPLDTLEDLEGEQLEAMRGWEERFEKKYLVVGKLVAVGSPEAEEAKAQW
ncbi:hypothetical protein BKA66DRAFT_514113 [Pyrenochaeta sp. MPI-SDFR-AT-0127]|nr:hypothetical protein BKA66DRAFT_514113 [Pyrenochaeta sp. MPI-SDFR-AT-0127]